jgi:hypothetical protein
VSALASHPAWQRHQIFHDGRIGRKLDESRGIIIAPLVQQQARSA